MAERGRRAARQVRVSGSMLDAAAWTVTSTAPNAAADPAAFAALSLPAVPAIVPGTAAQTLPGGDALDFWYRCMFRATDGERARLRFDGLATIAEVWLNGESILESRNMFEQHRVAVSLRAANELLICFRSLDAALGQRRPRPRWKTRLVRQQQLRWFRTTLLGRIPGWTPPVPPVGPWRAIALEPLHAPRDVAVRTSLDGTTGVVDFSCYSDREASGTFHVGEQSTQLRVERDRDAVRVTAQLRIDDVALWWPHTHGEPALYSCSATIDGAAIDCGHIGFRTIEAVQTGGDFALRVNGVDVFCRGACWTTNDIVSLAGNADQYRATLQLLRDAGASMIRVGGTMVYEQDAFYAACDEAGILVWQDFMFANMDYPADDAQFVASVRNEASQQLTRLAAHPSVVVWCGNSEVEQQAAMVGAPRESWRNPLFAEVLPSLCAELHPNSVYVPSTPSGGTLPFQTASGLTHYYGVGAYLRPITDVRRADVRFTPECLGFANVPDQEVVDLVMNGDAPATHDPRWKERTPRDTGAGWDFEDVRDHYTRALFDVDPTRVRYADTAHYLALGRVATGEVMSQVFAEWRSPSSRCRGALVWFLRDLWPGAGWGILDSRGIPKACFYFLRRAWQPRAVVLTDEGLNGVHAHVINERAEPLAAMLDIRLLRDGHVVMAEGSAACELAPRAKATFEAEAVLGAFYDTAYAYRFGPPKHDVLIATLTGSDGDIISEAFHFPLPAEPRRIDATITANAQRDGDVWTVSIEADRFLYAAHVDAPGFIAGDNYFHLAPGRTKRVHLTPLLEPRPLRGYIDALNLGDALRIVVNE